MYPQSMLLTKLRNLSFSAENYHFYSCESVKYHGIVLHWACLHNDTACVCKVMDLAHSPMILKVKKKIISFK